jgi:hypothetical protein
MSPTRTRKRFPGPPRRAQKTIIVRLPEPLFFRFRRRVLERQEAGSQDSGNDVVVALLESWLSRQASA